ncbi:hypothetical protein ACFYVR_25075 [Rhodococcus sp. NPDC003318]|uniref:hypothetical protein n=1 Tax=Rhodococcus sp. NPDC003318 TaxID=3364503 RepID=UPI0036CE90F0
MTKNKDSGSTRVIDAVRPPHRVDRSPVPPPSALSTKPMYEQFGSAAKPGKAARSRVISATGPLRDPEQVTTPQREPARVPTSSPGSRPDRRRYATYAGLGLGIVTVVGLVGWGATSLIGLADDDSSVANRVTTPAAAKPVVEESVADGCATGEGDTATGEGVITALEHRYYQMRSGQAVRELMAPDTQWDVAQIQAGINSVPLGTTHCVKVTAIGPNAYSAQITERRPDGDSTFKQRVGTVTSPDGRVLIKTISEVNE